MDVMYFPRGFMVPVSSSCLNQGEEKKLGNILGVLKGARPRQSRQNLDR